MLANSFRLRGVKFAFLFGPPRFVQRDEASTVHSAVCDRTHLDDFSFKYSTIEPEIRLASKGFSIVFERKEGQGTLSARIDNKNIHEPIRLLLEHTWPPTREHVIEYFDNISESVFESLGGDWTRVFAEVRLRAQCNTRSNDGLAFLKEKVFGLPTTFTSELGGPLTFCSAKLEISATNPPSDKQIEGAKRDLLIEPLREDQTCIYLELVSQWPHVTPIQRNQAGPVVIGNIRTIESNPGIYIQEALSFFTEQVEKLDDISKE
jgi:hypothetical protein